VLHHKKTWLNTSQKVRQSKQSPRPTKQNWTLEMPTDQENEQNHQDILVNVEKSKSGVQRVAAWLNDKGYTVTVPPMVVVQSSYEDRMNHIDNGDLFLHQRMEVKVRSIDFTCAQDYPFKDGIYVCAQHSYDNAKPKPHSYIILNKNMTHAAIIMGDTKNLWTVKNVKDSRYKDFTQPIYSCPVSAVKFTKL
jgi:hypothetical protein